MRIRRYFPKSIEQMFQLFRELIPDKQEIVIHSGHFLLIGDEKDGSVFPCIAGESKEKTTEIFLETHGRFPVFTWELALRLVQSLELPLAYLMVVVNDWQHVPEGCDRNDFYSKTRCINEVYEGILEQYPEIQLLTPNEAGLTTGISTYPYFSEMNLRNRFSKRIKKMLKKGGLPAHVATENLDGSVRCTVPDSSGGKREIYCDGKSSNCSGEVAQMISEAYDQTGCRTFVNFYPIVCKNYVEQGSVDAIELFGLPLHKIINIGFRSSAVSSVDDLFSSIEVSVLNID